MLIETYFGFLGFSDGYFLGQLISGQLPASHPEKQTELNVKNLPLPMIQICRVWKRKQITQIYRY